MKTCTGCAVLKPVTDFYKSHSCKGRLTTKCKVCIGKQQFYYSQRCEVRLRKKDYQRLDINKKRAKDQALNKKFGIGLKEFETLHSLQKGLCAICGNPETRLDFKTKKVKTLAIDHCHKTGAIRGLLCGDCNLGLGNFKDRVQVLKNAIIYLNRLLLKN